VTIADRRHVDDLSLDQLRAIVGMQHADLGHAVVVMDREPMRARPAVRLGAHGGLIVHSRQRYAATGLMRSHRRFDAM
jgi:hypothetical protein